MILHKPNRDPDRLWLGRGTQGVTVQEVVAERDGGRVRLTVRRLGGEPVTVKLDPAEQQALRDWLMPVPHTYQEDQP